jgi:predicted DNA-binding antitoxin AbrB/MazE fold protein
MTVHTQAIYEQGVLRPVQPLGLDEGACVEVTVEINAASGKQPYEILSAIAALPLEVNREETAGREHNRFLYGTASGGEQRWVVERLGGM